jgi:hypothetical protein
MTLLLTHLISILMEEELLPADRLSELLRREDEILASRATDPRAKVYLTAHKWITECTDHLRNDYSALASTGSEGSPLGDRILQHIHRGEQLAAQQLDMLDRMP